MRELMAGDTVKHPCYGTGSISEMRQDLNGYYNIAVVRFAGATWWVPVRTLTKVRSEVAQ